VLALAQPVRVAGVDEHSALPARFFDAAHEVSFHAGIE